MKAHWGFMLAVACLSTGCDRFSAALTTAPDRINAAFPVRTEVLIAQTKLIEAAAAQPENQKLIHEQVKQMLQVRALVCAGATRIGHFDLAADIKGKLTDTECFKKQDVELANWIGVRRLGMALGQQALRPLRELPPKAILQGVENASTMAVATEANVAVLKSNAGKFTVIDLSGGKPINSFQAPGEAHHEVSLSPNGRLLAVPTANRFITVYEVESGSVIWSSDRYRGLIAWVPGAQAVVLDESGTGKAVVLDLYNVRPEPYLPTERNLQWSLDLPGGNHRKLVGSSNAVSVVDHQRNSDTSMIFAQSGQWQLAGRGISAQTPILMNNGKLLVYLSHPDLAWLDLETGQQGIWAMSALNAHGFTKLDELRLLFNSHRHGSYTSESKVLDVRSQMVFTARDIKATEGYALKFAPRAGHAKTINNALVIHTTAQTDDPQPLEQLISQAQLDVQLAKLNPQPMQSVPTIYSEAEHAAAKAASAAANAAAAAAEGTALPNRKAYVELLTKQVRAANVASAMRDGLPRDVVERIRNGTNQPARNAASASPPQALLTDVPANAEVVVLGVYQGKKVDQKSAGSASRPTGLVDVNVSGGSMPVVLVLSSYEPVSWNIQNSGGRKIAAILLSGYHDSTVQGVPKVKTLKIGTQYAYKLGSPEYDHLKTDISRYVSNPVHSFQGRYEGSSFSVSN